VATGQTVCVCGGGGGKRTSPREVEAYPVSSQTITLSSTLPQLTNSIKKTLLIIIPNVIAYQEQRSVKRGHRTGIRCRKHSTMNWVVHRRVTAARSQTRRTSCRAQDTGSRCSPSGYRCHRPPPDHSLPTYDWWRGCLLCCNSTSCRPSCLYVTSRNKDTMTMQYSPYKKSFITLCLINFRWLWYDCYYDMLKWRWFAFGLLIIMTIRLSLFLACSLLFIVLFVCHSVRKLRMSYWNTRKPSWCWHTRATQKRWKKFLHFEVITSSRQVGNPVFIVIKFLIQITSTYNNS